ncbi:MAG: hypothetical protein GWM87_10540, partial [Xanthomonadales bacterium]|nr:hypothetical protein [Xanthomonadales bacterium]NIX13325.1 hypothetical protein [Xanthomonadales bacterium]
MNRQGYLPLFLAALLVPSLLAAQEPPDFEDPADYPLMGDWTGRWLNPKGWP